MKKLGLISVFLFSFLAFSSVSEAAYGPYLSFDIGGYSRRIEENCPQCVDSITHTPLLKIYGFGDSTRMLAKMGLDLHILDFYLTFGGSTLIVDEFDGFHGKMSPAIGGGFKILMYESPTFEHLKLFINPDVIYFKSSDTIQFYSLSLGYVTESHDISWTEYAIRVGGSSRHGPVEAYGGIKLSFVEGQETGPVFGTADFKEMDNFGLFFGAHFDLDPRGMASFFGEIGGGDSAYLKVGILSRF